MDPKEMRFNAGRLAMQRPCSPDEWPSACRSEWRSCPAQHTAQHAPVLHPAQHGLPMQKTPMLPAPCHLQNRLVGVQRNEGQLAAGTQRPASSHGVVPLYSSVASKRRRRSTAIGQQPHPAVPVVVGKPPQPAPPHVPQLISRKSTHTRQHPALKQHPPAARWSTVRARARQHAALVPTEQGMAPHARPAPNRKQARQDGAVRQVDQDQRARGPALFKPLCTSYCELQTLQECRQADQPKQQGRTQGSTQLPSSPWHPCSPAAPASSASVPLAPMQLPPQLPTAHWAQPHPLASWAARLLQAHCLHCAAAAPLPPPPPPLLLPPCLPRQA